METSEQAKKIAPWWADGMGRSSLYAIIHLERPSAAPTTPIFFSMTPGDVWDATTPTLYPHDRRGKWRNNNWSLQWTCGGGGGGKKISLNREHSRAKFTSEIHFIFTNDFEGRDGCRPTSAVISVGLIWPSDTFRLKSFSILSVVSYRFLFLFIIF